ncbi:hypothetical protein HBB16_00315 [Pseudonocardia sp. MCCB 268]|nr:hypothetical protein [Pseudonocardia cytotoxica]
MHTAPVAVGRRPAAPRRRLDRIAARLPHVQHNWPGSGGGLRFHEADLDGHGMYVDDMIARSSTSPGGAERNRGRPGAAQHRRLERA